MISIGQRNNFRIIICQFKHNIFILINIFEGMIDIYISFTICNYNFFRIIYRNFMIIPVRIMYHCFIF